jgi:hypothetical protein
MPYFGSIFIELPNSIIIHETILQYFVNIIVGIDTNYAAADLFKSIELV